MKKYLRMNDVFKGELFIDSDCDDVIVDDLSLTVLESFSGSDAAKFAIHAINSHDELVAMNKELLVALEKSVELTDHFGSAYACEPSNYIEYKMAVNAIAKAKVAS